jgi:CRISPR-associated exonuclease Cas4
MMDRDEYLMLSGIQHYYFCKRQWAMIHIEQVWNDNLLTYSGSKMHKKADNPYILESRGTYFLSRSMPVYSDTLKLYGICDVVQFLKVESEGVKVKGKQGLYEIAPIEYKYGQEKSNDMDNLQLVAQTICLEEMFKTKIKKAFLYYGRTKTRKEVEISEELREKTIFISREMNDSFKNGKIPEAVHLPHCKKCSLVDLCNPKVGSKNNQIERYFKNFIESGEE